MLLPTCSEVRRWTIRQCQLSFTDSRSSTRTESYCAGSSFSLRKDQIIVWLSVLQTGLQFDRNSAVPSFPAILDTGHNHNFILAEPSIDQAVTPSAGCPNVHNVNGSGRARIVTCGWLTLCHRRTRGRWMECVRPHSTASVFVVALAEPNESAVL